MLFNYQHAASSLLRRLVARGLPALFFCTLGLIIQSAAEAGNISITINDSTETISSSTTDTSGRAKPILCPDLSSTAFEDCIFGVQPPSSGATVTSVNFPFQPGNNLVVIGDAEKSTVSDTLSFIACNVANCSTAGTSAPVVAYQIVLNSDPATETQSGNLGGPCSALAGGCQIIENGNVQPAGTVTWSDGSVDTVNFSSDSEVPEPSSALLLLPGLAGICAVRRFTLSA